MSLVECPVRWSLATNTGYEHKGYEHTATGYPNQVALNTWLQSQSQMKANDDIGENKIWYTRCTPLTPTKQTNKSKSNKSKQIKSNQNRASGAAPNSRHRANNKSYAKSYAKCLLASLKGLRTLTYKKGALGGFFWDLY